ncbi:MAG: LysM peptidoglycan-binding domain-containing protein [Betaproteobacteria bacterium]|nr:MAG: LysM peptidoglycan-binding domain-containing protein [Betaproteobacteria bacterium]
MRKSVIKTSALALAFLLLPSLAAAAGLGKLTVLSGLGQPLKAEIELLALQKGEADNLSVRLPSADAFRKANIEYSGALLSVKFSIQQHGENRYVVVLSSTQPMNEPFLDLLVELDWTTGRLVREYTFLLDPPEYKGPPSAPAMTAPVTGSAAIKSVELPKQPPSVAPATGAGRTPAAAAPAAAAPSPAPKAAPKAVASYTVKRGDTLTKIATANKSAGISLQQMLIALYRSNADAFDDNNINRMRAGKILNIPDSDAAASIDQDEAVRTVLAQGTEFNEYRRKLGAAVAGAPERADKRRQSASGKITARVEDKPAAAKDTPDQLRLSKTQEPGKPGAKGGATVAQEDLLAKEKALREANERIAMLEKNVQDMRKLLELKSQTGAQMQGQAAKAVETAKAPAPVKAPEPAKGAEAVKAPDAAKTPAPASVEAPPKVTPPAVAPKPAPKPAPKVVAPPPPPETSLIDEILGNELALYGGGGFLLLLFAGYGYYAWRRKKSLQSMESSVMATPDLASDSVFGAAGGAKVDTGPSEIQGEFGQGGAVAAMDTEEVDPIAEADVYMAYGRDTQAEEILKEALAKNPSRLPIRAKLLEIYANRKDTKAFEAQAAEIHAATNGDGMEWNKAVSLGAQLDPGNPLYSGKSGDGTDLAVTDTQVVSGAEATPDIVLDMGGETQASPELDFDLGLSEPEPGAAAPATDVTGDLGFDLDLGEAEKAPEGQTNAAAGDTPAAAASEVEAPAEAAASIDFDFELPASGAAAEPAAAALQAPVAAADGASIDFDFNLDLPAETEQAPAAPLDLSAISLDLGAPGEAAPAPDAHWQEVATKLDLAKAYQEMGDKDGSRELLNEVLKEGDAAQQQQAQTMLAALG